MSNEQCASDKSVDMSHCVVMSCDWAHPLQFYTRMNEHAHMHPLCGVISWARILVITAGILFVTLKYGLRTQGIDCYLSI